MEEKEYNIFSSIFLLIVLLAFVLQQDDFIK